jgi:CheY-like chemotaxis protein
MTERKRAEEVQQAFLEQREARLQAEQERRRAEASVRVAQEANRAKDEFLMTLSHELRTPMTSILGWARLLPTIATTDATFPEAIAAIGRSAQLQARLIDDVLDLSRIASGKLRLNVDSVNVLEVLLGAIEGMRHSADAKQIAITTSLTPDLGVVTVDATRLQQIVWNLLSNAVKFTPKGGRIELGARRTSSQLQISVTDSGEGIDPQFLPHVFEAFRQAESPSTRVHGGLGLGLSIVRYLVEAHGGSVSVESEGRGRGARFTVTLPIRAVQIASQEERVRATESLHPAFLTSLAGRRILVVDDDRDGRELIAAALRRAGADVEAVESGDDALRFVADHAVDMVITDIAMPEMDGFALQRRLREIHALDRIPIVALTAFPPTVMSVDEKEFATYLRKPIDPFELTSKVNELLKPAS